MEMKALIEECLQLLEKLEKEFPSAPDLEALHAVTGIYATMRKYRDRIGELPTSVRLFCEFIHSANCPAPEMAAFLDFLRNHPEAFSSAEGGTFLAKRQRISAIAEQAGLNSARVFHLVSMAKLKGILNKKNDLAEDYASLIADYLS
jgi:hypothetical protein